jgi:Flp pilus assembly protein CpaB
MGNGHASGTGDDGATSGAMPKRAARARRALSARLSPGHVVMLLAGALGVLFTLNVLRAADDTTPVLLASRDLAPGTLLDEHSVRIAHLRADPSVVATLFAGEQASLLRGQVVTATVREGELLARGAVRAVDARAAQRVMSFSIPRPRAADGRLAPGDHVDVIAVDKDARQARYVLVDAEVVAIDDRGSGALSGISEDVTVTIVVDPDVAIALAIAIDTETVSLVRSTGAPEIKP